VQRLASSAATTVPGGNGDFFNGIADKADTRSHKSSHAKRPFVQFSSREGQTLRAYHVTSGTR
jgi:hypothetical protein